jgi:RHS repeat-associated protein
VVLENAREELLAEGSFYSGEYRRAVSKGTAHGVPPGRYYLVYYTTILSPTGWEPDDERTEAARICKIDGAFGEYLKCTTKGYGYLAPPAPPSEQRAGGGAPGEASHPKCTCDPINPQDGEYWKTQTDVSFGGRESKLTMTRTYSSSTRSTEAYNEPLGAGWHFSLGAYLTIVRQGNLYGTVTVYNGNGSATQFENVGESPTGPFAPPPGVMATLEGNAEGIYTYTIDHRETMTFRSINYSEGQLTSISDSNGNVITLSYEGELLVKATDSAGRWLAFSYKAGPNETSRLSTVTDSAGRTVSYEYNSADQLAAVTGVDGGKTEYTYEKGRLATERDPRGNVVVKNTYESSGRIATQTNALGGESKFTYEAGTHPEESWTSTEIATSSGRTSKFVYEHGYLAVEEVRSAKERLSYVSYGYQTSEGTVLDGEPARMFKNNEFTEYTYDAEGKVTSEYIDGGGLHPVTHLKTYQYDAQGDLTAYTNPDGVTTTYTYDAYGNRLSSSTPVGEDETATSSYTYDSEGDLASYEDASKHLWRYEYNAAGNRVAEIDPEGNKRTKKYNAAGYLIEETDPRGFTTKFGRNAQGQVLFVDDPLNRTTMYTYDADGNLQTVTDPEHYKTVYGYNAANELTKTERPGGLVTETEYNPEEEAVAQVNGNKQTTKYVRNAVGNIVEEIDPLGNRTTKTYDENNNLLEESNEKGTTSYTYNALNEPIKVSYSGGKTATTEYEYDEAGLEMKMTDGTGTTTYTYNSLDQLLESKDGHGEEIKYEYDLGDGPVRVTYPNGKAVTRTYDPDERLESVTDWLGNTTKFAYNADGELESTIYPSGTREQDSTQFNEADEPSEIKMSRGAEVQAAVSYGRNKDGEVTKTSGKGLPGAETLKYKYDDDGRLTKAGSTTYKYDAADDVVAIGKTSYKYNADDELEQNTLKKQRTTYAYNEIGERVKSTPPTGPATEYGYNAARDLVSVAQPAEGKSAAIDDTYTYSGEELLASESVSGVTSYFAWDVEEPLPVILSDGTNNYVYGPDGRAVEQIGSEGKVYYLHHDEQGSTRLITTSTGAVEGGATYTPYGSDEETSGKASSPLGYDGQYTSSDTGLIYMRARTYDPKTAQFLSADPLVGVTRTPYTFALDSPVNWADPTGEGGFWETAEHFVLGVAGIGDTLATGVTTVVATPFCFAGVSAAPVIGEVAGYPACATFTVGGAAFTAYQAYETYWEFEQAFNGSGGGPAETSSETESCPSE